MSVEVWAGWVFFFTIFDKEKMWKLGMERNARIRERNDENGTKKEEKKPTHWIIKLYFDLLVYPVFGFWNQNWRVHVEQQTLQFLLKLAQYNIFYK